MNTHDMEKLEKLNKKIAYSILEKPKKLIKKLNNMTKQTVDKTSRSKEKKYVQANSNVSIDRDLDGREYVGWLLNQIGRTGVLYFYDTYGGKWKLQKLKDK